MPKFAKSSPSAPRGVGSESQARDDLPQRIERPDLGDFIHKYPRVHALLLALISSHNEDMDWTERDRFDLSSPLRKLAASADTLAANDLSNAAALADERAARIARDNVLAGEISDLEVAIAAIEDAIAALPSISVESIFGRSGVVVAASGDYSADQITETSTHKILTSAERTKLASALVSADIGVSVQGYDVDTLKSDQTKQLTAGYTSSALDLGTVTTGTVTPNITSRTFQYYTNDGAHTLAVPTGGYGGIYLDVTNGATAGAIDTSAFTIVAGDSLTTTSGHIFRLAAVVGPGGSSLHIKAMQ